MLEATPDCGELTFERVHLLKPLGSRGVQAPKPLPLPLHGALRGAKLGAQPAALLAHSAKLGAQLVALGFDGLQPSTQVATLLVLSADRATLAARTLHPGSTGHVYDCETIAMSDERERQTEAFVFYEFGALREVDLDAIFDAAEPSVARIAPGHESPEPRVLGPEYAPPPVWNPERKRIGPVELIALPNVELGVDFTPYRDGLPILSPRIFRTIHLRTFYESGWDRVYGRMPIPRAERRIEEPVYCVTHFKMTGYGHFLLEVFPKLLLIRELRAAGHRYRVALPSTLPPFTRAMLHEVWDGEDILYYDNRSERLDLARAILPTVMTSLNCHLNDVLVAEMRALALRIAMRPGATELPGPRLFISRLESKSFRKLANEATLQAIAAEQGFQPVRPEQMAWPDQVRMFNLATHVIGEYSSALHNAVFCTQGTKVLSLGWLQNHIQAGIAASMGHTLGCLMPRDSMPEFKSGWTESEPFEVDADDFRRSLDAMS